MIRTLIVSEVRLYRMGLEAILAEDGRLEILGSEETGPVALDAVRELEPQAVLLDIAFPDALELAQEMTLAAPHTSVVALGLREVERNLIECAEAGMSGFVSQDGSTEELVKAVESAVRGELACTSRVAGALLRRIGAMARLRTRESEPLPLTPRERQVVRLLERGQTNKEIAHDLHIEVSTVKNHVHNILEKLGVSSRAKAASKFRRAQPSRRSALGTRPRIQEQVDPLWISSES